MKGVSKRENARISVVVPFYNEEQNVYSLYQELEHALRRYRHRQYVFVNDGSRDLTWHKIESIAKSNSRVVGISHRIRKGEATALATGFAYATGDVIVTIDGDLQDDPSDIEPMLRKLESGYDFVCGWKKQRYEPINRSIFLRLFNDVTRKLTGLQLHELNTGFRAMTKEVAKTLPLYGERHRFVPVLASFLGFSATELAVKHRARKYGRSKQSIVRLFIGLFDLLQVVYLTQMYRRPLHVFGLWGVIFVCAGIAFGIFGAAFALARSQLFTSGIAFVFSALFVLVGVQIGLFGLLSEQISDTRLWFIPNNYIGTVVRNKRTQPQRLLTL